MTFYYQTLDEYLIRGHLSDYVQIIIKDLKGSYHKLG